LTTKSASGMTASDICDIIKACADSGVKHFVFGELEFVLDDAVPTKYAEQNKVVEYSDTVDDNEDKAPEEVEEFDMAELALSDPLRYEELMNQAQQ